MSSDTTWEWEIVITAVHDWGPNAAAEISGELVAWRSDDSRQDGLPRLPRSQQRYKLVEVTDE